jgi:hypothetical protein
MPVEMNEQAQYYIRFWRRIVVDFLGRGEAELDELVAKWRYGLAEENSMFYHEAPEYYVAPNLVPEALARSLPSSEWMRLCWAIYPVISRYDRECGLAAECFESMRNELDRTIADWVAANRRVRRAE